jgi:tetratricopeptide (TPR) repeat protein
MPGCCGMGMETGEHMPATIRKIACAVALAAMASLDPAQAQDHIICEKESGDVAIAACDRAIASGKLSSAQLAWAYHNRAVEYENKAKYELALADYDRALKIDPNRAGSLVGRGNNYSLLGKHQLAIADYNRALRILPDSPNALHNRGVAYARMKDYKRARADYERAIAVPARDEADRGSQDTARKLLSELPSK